MTQYFTRSRWQRGLSLLSHGALLAAFTGCGSNPAVSTSAAAVPDAGTPAPTPDGFQMLGTIEASVKGGHLQFQSFRPTASSTPGQKTQNFGNTNQYVGNEVWFATDPGDGDGTGTCTATQYCATVPVTNRSGRRLDDFFAEVTRYHDIIPATEVISWAGSPFTYSPTYASAFANPGHVEAAFYGNFDVDQVNRAEWKFNTGMSQGFSFTVGILASVRRSDYLSSTQANAATIDACAIAGNTQYFASTDDAETDIALPFPYTLYDKTYDRAVLGSNGYALFERTGDAVPTLSNGVTNASLAADALPGLYPFWDDLAFDADGGVCVATSGSVPNRTVAITWKNAKINDAQPSKGSWAASRITASLLLTENTDQVAFEYLLPDAGITDLTRGSSATTGEVGIVNDVQVGTDFSNNTLSPNIPASSSSYPFKLTRLPDGGPVQIPTTTPVLQKFNEMGDSATGTLPRAWKIDGLANPRTIGTYASALNHTNIAAGAAMTTTAANGLFSFGPGPNDSSVDEYWAWAWDRAVGWLSAGAIAGSGGTKSGDLYVQLQAPAGADLSALELSYDIQKFRNGTNPSGFVIQLYYSTDGSMWTSAGNSFKNTFAADADNTGYDPAPGSSVSVPTTALPLSIPRSSTLYLAWNYTLNSATSIDASNAQALAIDNVSIKGDAICVPSCAGKQCGDSLSDGCGGTCPAVCTAGQVGCTGDSECTTGNVCSGRVASSPTPDMCVTPICVTDPRRGGCGQAGSPCGTSCTVEPTCHSNTDCPTNYVCPTGNGRRYGFPALRVCEPPACATSPVATGCGSVYSACGLCP